MLRNIAIAALVLISAPYVNAGNEHDTLGNVTIKDMNFWGDHVDIYLSDLQQHKCSGGLKSRYIFHPDKQALLSVVLMSFASEKKVNLAYDCGADNYPWVVGIRVKGS